jgi:hypothetical protein
MGVILWELYYGSYIMGVILWELYYGSYIMGVILCRAVVLNLFYAATPFDYHFYLATHTMFYTKNIQFLIHF